VFAFDAVIRAALKHRRCGHGAGGVLTFSIILHRQDCPPDLHEVDACDMDMARAIALDLLDGRADHVGVEIWFGKRRLFVRGAALDRRRERDARVPWPIGV